MCSRHFIVLPQGQSCNSQSLVPSLRPVTTLIVSFDMRSTTAVIDGAKSQSPTCGAHTALSLALSRGPLAPSSSSLMVFFMTLSHSFCLLRISSLEMSVFDLVFHELIALCMELSVTSWSLSGRMSFWICSVPIADAKKAEGANLATLRISSSQSLIGRVACVRCNSLMSTLRAPLKRREAVSEERT